MCSTGVSLASTRIVKFWPISSTQILSDRPEPEGNSFIEAFGTDFSAVLDSLSIADRDAAGTD